MPAQIDHTACAAKIQNDGFRLVGVTKIHQDRMLAEVNDPDPQRQRGNGFAFGFAQGVVSGYIDALRAFGFDDKADQLAYALEELDPANSDDFDEVAGQRER